MTERSDGGLPETPQAMCVQCERLFAAMGESEIEPSHYNIMRSQAAALIEAIREVDSAMADGLSLRLSTFPAAGVDGPSQVVELDPMDALFELLDKADKAKESGPASSTSSDKGKMPN